MFRVGIVQAQDAASCRVRVKFPERDEVQSWWLHVVTLKTQNDKFYWLPDIGEQVVCLMDEYDEEGAVIGAIYSAADVTPVQNADRFHAGFKDGAFVEYDRKNHSMSVSLPAGGTIQVASGNTSVTVDASGDVKIVAAGQIQLGGGSLKGVARLGDSVTCPAGSGTIVTASSNVLAD